MAHVPPFNDDPPANTPILDALANHQDDLVAGLYTNPVTPEQVTQFSDLFTVQHPEPTGTSLPGYARWQGAWQLLFLDSQAISIRARPFFAAGGGNPPAALTVEGCWVAMAQAGGAAPLLLQVIPFEPPVTFASDGDGVIPVITLTASAPPAPAPATLSGTAAYVASSGGQSAPGRLPGREFRGQDRRMVEEVVDVLTRALAHDQRIQLLSSKTRRSSIEILDSQDQTIQDGVQQILDRMQLLLIL